MDITLGIWDYYMRSKDSVGMITHPAKDTLNLCANIGFYGAFWKTRAFAAWSRH